MSTDIGVRILLLVAMSGSGILMIWVARAAASGRLKRNPIAGIRMSTTMRSDEAWLAAHVRAERATMCAGFAAVASGLIPLLPLPAPALAAVVLAGCAAMIGFGLYGARVGARAAADVSMASDD